MIDKNSKILLMLILIFFISKNSYCQEDIGVPITVKCETKTADGKAVEGVNIVVSKNNKQIASYKTDKKGKSIIDDFVQNTEDKKFVYSVVFSKPGFVTKTLELNSYIPSEDFDEMPFEIKLDVSMVATQYSNVKIDRPYGKIKWHTKTKEYAVDQDYSKEIAVEEKLLMQNPDKYLQEYEKKMDNALSSSAEKEKQDKYDASIKKADAAFNVKNYEIAKESYKQALGIKPSEKYPSSQIAAIDKLIAEIAVSGSIKNKYDAAIAKADKAFASKDYSSAKNAYNEALTIKAFEQYPKDKLKEIERLVAADNVQSEKAAYVAAIAKGDVSFKNKDYASAKLAYQEASKIRPTEQLPVNKLKEIESILASTAKPDRDYQVAIAKGDAAFKAKKFENAIAAFKAALVLKPKEKYPKDKITEAEKIIADAKNKELLAEKERLANEEKTKVAAVLAEKERLDREAKEKALAEAVKNDIDPVGNTLEPAFDGSKIFSITKEKLKMQEEKKKFEKNKSENLALKYETNNISTSLMDVVDVYDKKNKK